VTISNEEFADVVRHYSIHENLLYLGNALSGEVGEVANVIKKIRIRELLTIRNEKISSNVTMSEYKENLIDELGDVLFYVTGTCNRLGVSLDDLKKNQVAKLERQSKELGMPFRK